MAQKYLDNNGEIVYCPVHHQSRVLTSTEMNYGKVEEELLAALSSIKSNKMFLYGHKFKVVVDHRPMVPLYYDPGRPTPARVDRH